MSVQEPASGLDALGGTSRDRFGFGKNWLKFLRHIDEERIAASEAGLTQLLGTQSLAGKTFLDIGSGSGLSSLSARRMGATVHSFDFDRSSVAATNALRRRSFPEDDRWRVEHGSVLDEAYMRSLGQFDIVYSWGVLHHTGDLWRALGQAAGSVKPGGQLFVAIYNDAGLASRIWRLEKHLYVRSPSVVRLLLVVLIGAEMGLQRWIYGLIKAKSAFKPGRGMSAYHDLVDWVGGYPFEFATPGAVFSFLQGRGFELERMETHTTAGANNQYVFRRTS